jgi:hypothetical protein
MDRIDPADWSSILMLVVAYGKRVLPLAWQVLDGGHQIRHTLNLIRNDLVSAGLERLWILLCRPQHIEIIQRMIAPVPDQPGILQECALIHLPRSANTTARCSVIAVWSSGTIQRAR